MFQKREDNRAALLVQNVHRWDYDLRFHFILIA
jgi:hypothetical protein